MYPSGRSAASTPLRARNPTLQRLGALRVWTFVRIEIIAIQPDLTGHKLEPVRSFRVPECCGTRVRYSKIAIIARFCKEALCRDPNEESPESQWLFGAVWGAQPQRPPRGIITNQHTITKEAPTQRGASFRISDSGRFPSGSPQRNAQTQSEPTMLDNRTPFENALMAIPTLAE